MTIAVTPWDGKPITKPGFYADVPMAKYHSGFLCVSPSLSSSGLRTIFNKSEAHFYDRWPRNPQYNKDADEESEGMILGRATHHALLSQPHFRREFVTTPESCVDAKGVMQPFSYRFHSAQDWRKQQIADGLTILTKEQENKIQGMALRLMREPLVANGALNGLVEVTMAWPDRAGSGVWFLARPDVIPTDSGDFCDLKTIGRDVVSYGRLVQTIGEYGYHMQAALVREGWEVLTKRKMASFSFYFVETSRPHCARMVTLRDGDLDLGMRQCRNATTRFVTAFNTGNWPGPGGLQAEALYIDLSEGKRSAIESELRLMGEKKEERAA